MSGHGSAPDYVLQSAMRLHQAGNLAEAARLYNQVLRTNPKHFGALQMLGFLHFQRAEFEDAAQIMAKALKIDPRSVDALYNRGCALQALERHKEALQCFDKAVALKPDFAAAYLNRGNALFQLGRRREAVESYDLALKLQPQYAEALLNRANALFELERPEEALSNYDKALTLEPRQAILWNNRGNALAMMERHADALESYDKALSLDSSYADAFENRGEALEKVGRHAEALAGYAHALAIAPDNPSALHKRARLLLSLKRPLEAFADFERILALDPEDTAAAVSRGVALADLGRHGEALAACEHALALDPASADAYSNRANALIALKRHAEALASSDKAIALQSNHAAAWHNRGSALSGLRSYADALVAFDKALALAPDNAPTWNSRGSAALGLKRFEESLQNFYTALALDPTDAGVFANRATVLSKLKRYPEALESCERALALDSGHVSAMRELFHCWLNTGDWRALAEKKAAIATALAAGRRAIQPFDNLTISDSEELNRIAAELWVADECPPAQDPMWRGERYDHSKIRLGYLSTDFRAHAVAFLIVGAFEHHDKARFETIAFSISPDDKSETRGRIVSAFDRFIDVRDRTDADVAALMREMEIDIAIDLNAYTGDSRTGIMAHRAAPIQVNYLGYPGTMGAPYIDYILADGIVIPEHEKAHYTENVVHLPGTYQANDSKRRVSTKIFSRGEAGLPQDGFVFCCFNQIQKIGPEMFSIWMRLLREVEGSVLWLLEDNRFGVVNLRREAEARGVDASRLVFAPRFTPAEHLARVPLADLFLDTLPYNAHTTGSDALWVGLPLVTCIGATFPGRVAASLLHAAELPELITYSLMDYEALALKLARDAGALGAVRAKLVQNRDGCALFDTARFTHHLESAYVAMWERHRQGLPPAGFAVAPDPRR